MVDDIPGLSREHSVEDKWANRALTAEMEVGKLTVRLEKNIAGWSFEQKKRELAERKLARAIRGIGEALSDLTLWSATETALDALKHTKDDISAMNNEKPNIAGAVDRVASELINNAVEEPPRPPLDDLYMDNKEPEPDHEAARRQAGALVAHWEVHDTSDLTARGHRDLNYARAYLVQAAELCEVRRNRDALKRMFIDLSTVLIAHGAPNGFTTNPDDSYSVVKIVEVKLDELAALKAQASIGNHSWSD